MIFSHAIIIRLFFEPEDPRASWRLAFFEAMALPCLQRQTCPDFEIWIRCHPAHRSRLEALDPRIRTFRDQPRREDAEIGLMALASLAGDGADLPRVDIQTRHDSDDLVSRHYVARIRKEVEKAAPGPLVVSFQPFKLDLATLRRHRMATRYHERRCSMFLSLYQPDKSDYRYIYDYNHRLIWAAFSRVATVPEGYCDLVIHGGNCHTKLEPRDEPI
ncbi:MAG: glycosyltransferase [Syntrophales bacterium]|nr:glycosyltransferase [Syntrophales bacterium]